MDDRQLNKLKEEFKIEEDEEENPEEEEEEKKEHYDDIDSLYNMENQSVASSHVSRRTEGRSIRTTTTYVSKLEH
jgi:hypothetical protein